MRHHLWRYLIGLSIAGNQLANSLSGGSPIETVSSRLGHARAHGSQPAVVACRVLELLDVHRHIDGRDHCDKAIKNQHDRLTQSEEPR
jgi:hypothetical protein